MVKRSTTPGLDLRGAPVQPEEGHRLFSTGDTGVVYVKELTGGDRLTLIDVEQLAFAEDRLLSTTDILLQLQEANRRLLQEDVALYQSSVSREEGEAISAQQAQLYRTYFGAVNRAPDEAGYEWWLDQLQTGQHNQGSAFTGMTQSDEFVLISDGTVSDFWLWGG